MEVHRLEREFIYNGVKLPDTTPTMTPARRRALSEHKRGCGEQRVRKRKRCARGARGRSSSSEATTAGRAPQLDPSLLRGRAGRLCHVSRGCCLNLLKPAQPQREVISAIDGLSQVVDLGDAPSCQFCGSLWSLSNAFTSAFKELDPIPQFRATAKLGEFLEARFSQSL